MKALAWILTAAAVLIGADVFVMSSDKSEPDAVRVEEVSTEQPLHGGNGVPPPPPDAF